MISLSFHLEPSACQNVYFRGGIHNQLLLSLLMSCLVVGLTEPFLEIKRERKETVDRTVLDHYYYNIVPDSLHKSLCSHPLKMYNFPSGRQVKSQTGHLSEHSENKVFILSFHIWSVFSQLLPQTQYFSLNNICLII